MPNASEHFKSATNLDYIPNFLFGTHNIHKDLIQNVNKWMDYPVNPVSRGGMLGWTFQNGPLKGQIIIPNNHRNLHHNPFDVAKVFGGGHHSNIDAFNSSVIHNQLDHSSIDRWLISNGYPGSAQFIGAGLFYGIGKGVNSAINNFSLVRNGKINYTDAIVNIAKDAGIGTIEGVIKLGIGAGFHQAVLSTGFEPLIGLSSAGGALVAGFTIFELGRDVTIFMKGEKSVQEIAINTVNNATRATVGLYTAKICAALGAPAGPLGMALGGLVGGVVGGILIDQVITNVMKDLKMQANDFIKPLDIKDEEAVRSITYSMYKVEQLKVATNQFVDEFIEIAFYEKIFDEILQQKIVILGESNL